MGSLVNTVSLSIAKLIASFDPESDTFKIHSRDPSNLELVATASDSATGTTTTSNSVSTSPYKLPKDVAEATLEWYTSKIATGSVSEARQNYLLELGAKQYVYDLTEQHQRADQQQDSGTASAPGIKHFSCLLDMIFILRDAGKVDATLPHNLLEEIFEIQTIGWCQLFWPYLMSRYHLIAHNLTGTKAPGITLIRLGNSLLKRLSKTQHAQFSGEILMYLARAFPLTEKSGLNIRGNYNVENITYYEGDGRNVAESQKKDSEGDVEMTEHTEAEIDSEKAKKDEMYRQFWSLQDIFRDPTVLFNGEDKNEKLEKLKTTLSTVLSELKEWESQYHTRRDLENETRRQEMDLSDDDNDDDNDDENDDENEDKYKEKNKDEEAMAGGSSNTILFVPKWLTRRDLFELQLKDVSFRRAILTQMSILIDFLLSFDTGSNSTYHIFSKIAPPPTNKSVMYNFELDPAYGKFLISLRQQIRRNGFQAIDFHQPYLRTVDAVLSRDRFWQMWKLHSCPPFGLPPITKESRTIAKTSDLASKKVVENSDTASTKQHGTILEEAAKKLRELQKSRPRFVHKLGTPQLSKVWRIPTGTEMLKNPKNYQFKNAETYYKELKEAEDEFRNNYEVEVSEEEEVGEGEEKKKVKKKVKKLLASSEELRELKEVVGSKNWRGLRAARALGLWDKFGKIGRNGGLSGLFEEPKEELEEKLEEKADEDGEEEGEEGGEEEGEEGEEEEEEAEEQKEEEEKDETEEQEKEGTDLKEEQTKNPDDDDLELIPESENTNENETESRIKEISESEPSPNHENGQDLHIKPSAEEVQEQVYDNDVELISESDPEKELEVETDSKFEFEPEQEPSSETKQEQESKLGTDNESEPGYGLVRESTQGTADEPIEVSSDSESKSGTHRTEARIRRTPSESSLDSLSEMESFSDSDFSQKDKRPPLREQSQQQESGNARSDEGDLSIELISETENGGEDNNDEDDDDEIVPLNESREWEGKRHHNQLKENQRWRGEDESDEDKLSQHKHHHSTHHRHHHNNGGHKRTRSPEDDGENLYSKRQRGGNA